MKREWIIWAVDYRKCENSVYLSRNSTTHEIVALSLLVQHISPLKSKQKVHMFLG